MSAFAAATRRVQRLHLCAPDDTLARRGVRLLEDALRTASLPDGGARTFIFRRLALKRFGSRISSQTLSLTLERHVAALRSLAVHAAAPAAARCAAVWFRDALEAHMLLALRIAEGASTQDWFWPLVVPEIARTAATPDRMRLVLRSLGRYPEAPAALPQLARVLVQRGHARLLCDAVGATEAAALLAPFATVARPAAVVDSDIFATAPLHGIRLPIDIRAARSAKIDSEWSEDSLPVQPASIRIEAAPSKTTEPELAPPDELNGQEVGSITGLEPGGIAGATSIETTPKYGYGVGESAVAETLTFPMAEAAEFRATFHRSPSALLGPAMRTASDPPDREATGSEPLDQPPWSYEVPTEAGGLMFLLPILAHLGYPQWLNEASEWTAARIDTRILALVCQRLELPGGDPAWHLCKTLAPAAPAHFRAPAIWTHGIVDSRRAWRRHSDGSGTRVCDASGRLLLAAWPGARRPAAFAPLPQGRRIVRQGPSPQHTGDLVIAVTNAWLTACRRWLRRSAGLGVANLVARRARFSLTPTHADMFFELSGVNLAVRRAGLDLDPGWIPWFGRIVGFHYGRMP